MKISIVVATRNRSDIIADCLAGLTRQQGDGIEMLIVDQSTDRQTAVLVREAVRRDPRIRYIHSDTVGASRARNIGIASSEGEIVAFTDDDCVPADDWAQMILAVFDEHPEVSAVFGRCLPWDEVRPGERPVALKLDTASRLYCGKGNPWRPGHGNNIAFRRQVFDAIGLFDENLGPGTPFYASEDADLAYRLLAAGMKALYSPRPVIRHKQFRHGEDLWKLERSYGIGSGGFYAKHLRAGDFYMVRLLLDRWWTVGLRHILYGMLTFRKTHIRLGWYRIAYSIAGMLSVGISRAPSDRAIPAEYAQEVGNGRT